jgi:flagellar biosynthesis protein FlhB
MHLYLSFKQVNKSEKLAIGLSLAILAYLLCFHAMILAVTSVGAIVFTGVAYTAKHLPFTSKLAARLKSWHILVGLFTIVLLLTGFDAPSYAIFLSGLETLVTNIAQNSNSSIAPETIKLLFNLIRLVFLLSIVAAAIFAYSQAQQGNDWRPIIGQVAMAFGIVLAIDVLTKLFAS